MITKTEQKIIPPKPKELDQLTEQEWIDYFHEMEVIDQEKWDAIDEKYADLEFEWYIQNNQFVNITHTPGIELIKTELKLEDD